MVRQGPQVNGGPKTGRLAIANRRRSRYGKGMEAPDQALCRSPELSGDPPDEGPVFIANDIYRRSTFGAKHPLSVQRVPGTIDLCRALGWLDDARYRNSVAASPAEVVRFHDPVYLSVLRRGERGEALSEDERARHNLGKLENPIHDTMYSRPATSAGAVLAGVELLAAGKARTVYSPAGGTHHGRPDRASGFCYFNDLVLGILRLLDHGFERILYLDFDAHHGDGVQDAFHDDPRVFTLSIHEAGRWPFTGPVDDIAGGAACNLPVPKGFSDDELDLLVDRIVRPLGERFGAQAMVIQCGADALADDPLSRLDLSNGALWRAVANCLDLAPKVLVTGGGGYNPWSVARCWSGVWATLNGIAIPDEAGPAGEAVLRAFTWNRAAGRNPPDRWFRTMADLPNCNGISNQVHLLCKDAVRIHGL